MSDFDDRLGRLEERLDRSYRHLGNVIATQRGIVDKSFDQARLALMEVQVALQSQAKALESQAEALKSQEEALRQHADETRESLRELVQLVQEREASTQAQLLDHERRLEHLEQQFRPPAA